MDLRPFAIEHAARVAAWAGTADEARYWCGHQGAAVPPEKVTGWGAEEGVRAFTFYDGDEPIGYGELWVDDAAGEVELARLIVAPDKRGHGVGRALVTGLAALARGHHPEVFLRVYPDNQAALRCYTAAGFVRVAADQEAEWNARQPVAYVWLRHVPDAV